MSTSMWVGTDEWGGLAPSQPRKDLLAPPTWRLEAVAATARPYALTVDRQRGTACFLVDRSDLGCNVWTLDTATVATSQITVDRGPSPFWEDSTPRVSPSGDRVAYTSDGWVAVADVSGGPARRLVRASSPVWLDDHVLAVLVEQELSRLPAADPAFGRTSSVTRMAVVDLADPWPRPATPVEWGDISDIVPAPGGSRVALVCHPPHDRNRSDIRVLDLSADIAVTVSALDGTHSTGPCWSPDGRSIAYACESPGWYELFVWDGTGESRRLTDDEADFAGARWSPAGDRLVASRQRWGRSDLVAIGVPDGAIEVIAPGGSWSAVDWLSAEDLVALYEDHRTPARIERVGLDGSRSVLFEPAPAPVRRAPHATPIEVTFPSSDGLEIHGFLFQPVAAKDRLAPVVVYPHGGPTSVYGDEWDGHAQYFVDKGYGWLAINYRGSTTYGRAFERANHGVWGVDDTADCLAAHRFLADLSWVDAERIAIFGASYGSYLALAALVSEPDRFRCGVAKYGDSDILTSWAQGDRGGSEDMERMMGHPADHREAYRTGSPIHLLDGISRPILVAHGEQDERVHPAQSRELVAELKRLGKTYEYVTYPTEGHGLIRSHPQIHFYRRLERFLDWYLM